MDNLRAAILRPQLANLDRQCERWNTRYALMQDIMQHCDAIRLTQRPEKEQYVASTIQFSLPNFSIDQIQAVVAESANRGVALKWFGADLPNGYTSRYDSWRYIDDMPSLPVTEKLLASLLDMRIPLTFTEQDCQLIAEIICDVVKYIQDK